MLGWEPLFSLDEGLRRTIAWYTELLGARMSAPRPAASCGATELHPVLSLGETPLANSLLTADAARRAGADLSRSTSCLCPVCTLVQITETVPPEVLFRDYLYFSSFSDTMLAARREARDAPRSPQRASAPTASSSRSRATTATCSQYYRAPACRCSASSPRGTSRRWPRSAGSRRSPSSSTPALAARLVAEGRRADVFHANNVLAHVADLNGFVEGIAIVLADDGEALIEVPYVKDMVDRCEFDTIYHEHLCYFSLTALEALFRRHGLAVSDVERIPIHGGSLRVFVRRPGSWEPAASVGRLLLPRRPAWHVTDPAPYDRFALRVTALGTELVTLLDGLKSRGATIAAYGAAAKGARC